MSNVALRDPALPPETSTRGGAWRAQVLVPSPRNRSACAGGKWLQDALGEMGIQGPEGIDLGLGKMHISFPPSFVSKLESMSLARPLKPTYRFGKLPRAPGEGSPVERLHQLCFQGGWSLL